jgi:rhodanese-related sulfurtransferase
VLRAAGEIETSQENIQDWLQLDEGDPSINVCVCTSVSTIVSSERIDRNVTAATNTHKNRRLIVFCAVRVVSRKAVNYLFPELLVYFSDTRGRSIIHGCDVDQCASS